MAGVVEVTLRGTSEGSKRANVLHYAYGLVSNPSESELKLIAQRWWTAVGNAYKASAGSGVNFDEVEAKVIASDSGTQYKGTYVIPQPAPGSIVQDLAPANAARVISWKTGQVSRHGRGRTFLFGLTDGGATGSTITTGQLLLDLAIALAMGQFTNSGGTVALYLIVYNVDTNFSSLVSAFAVDAFVDSMRRRLINRGN